MPNIDGWWKALLKEHRDDGRRDADKGKFNPPYPGSDDPQDEVESDAYIRGFNERRGELGSKFFWA